MLGAGAGRSGVGGVRLDREDRAGQTRARDGGGIGQERHGQSPAVLPSGA